MGWFRSPFRGQRNINNYLSRWAHKENAWPTSGQIQRSTFSRILWPSLVEIEITVTDAEEHGPLSQGTIQFECSPRFPLPLVALPAKAQ